MYVCMYVCMYEYVCIYIHTHTHIHIHIYTYIWQVTSLCASIISPLQRLEVTQFETKKDVIDACMTSVIFFFRCNVSKCDDAV